MKTLEEVKNSLQRCVKQHCRSGVEHCPYFVECLICNGRKLMISDALAYIEQLEEQIDLMKLQMRGDCGVCKHRSGCQINGRDINMSKTCYDCMMKETRPNWEYEGLPEVKNR